LWGKITKEQKAKTETLHAGVHERIEQYKNNEKEEQQQQ
jgi:hypothetical protein